MFSLLFEAPCRANFDFQIKNIDDEGNDAMNGPFELNCIICRGGRNTSA